MPVSLSVEPVAFGLIGLHEMKLTVVTLYSFISNRLGSSLQVVCCSSRYFTSGSCRSSYPGGQGKVVMLHL